MQEMLQQLSMGDEDMAQVPEIVTPEEFRRLVHKRAVTKFRSVRCGRDYPWCNKHDSLKEHGRAMELEMMQRSGLIKELQEQVPFELLPSHVLFGRKRPPVRYVADWTYWEQKGGIWEKVVEDCKSKPTRTPVWMLKMRLMKEKYGIEARLS